ncbi:MAG TPA: hypothetical protein VEL07_02975 [Planctomycetota bacterium]|nr:hypothetical protein [Planctomycetota bacterium]
MATLLLVLLGAVAAAAEYPPSNVPAPGGVPGEDVEAEGSNAPQPQDPVDGSVVTTNAAAVQGTMVATADEIENVRQQYALPGDPMALITDVLDENVEDLGETERAKAGDALWRWQRNTPALDIHLGVGTSLNGVDHPSAFPHRPEVFRFVTGGKNRLAGLNKSLKRASKWMNKHTCGGFDWTAQFQQAFRTQALVEYLESLPEGVAAALPMALIGAFSPQLAEIVKHLKLIAGFDISATKADCHAIENALTTGMRKDSWATGYSDCLQRTKSQGVKRSMELCQSQNASAAQNNEGDLVNVNTSQAGSSGWLSSSFSYSRDKLSEIFNDDAGSTAQTQQDAAAASASAQPGTNEGATAEGTANALSASANVRKMMDSSGRALESLSRSLYGSVRLHGNGSLEVNRKSINLFNLRVQSHCANVHETIISHLRNHYACLRDIHDESIPDRRESLAESYRILKIWTYHARGGHADSKPWLESTWSFGSSSPITDETMDACAYLVGMLEAYAENPPMKARLIQQYPIGEFITALARYEVYLYLRERMADVHNQLVMMQTSTRQSGAENRAVVEAEREHYKKATEEMNAAFCHIERTVLDLLPRINSYRPAPRSDQLERPYLTAPALTTPGLSFPAE